MSTTERGCHHDSDNPDYDKETEPDMETGPRSQRYKESRGVRALDLERPWTLLGSVITGKLHTLSECGLFTRGVLMPIQLNDEEQYGKCLVHS